MYIDDQIEQELIRLNWFCTAQQPTQFTVSIDDVPAGYVSIYDDYIIMVDKGEKILAALKAIPVGTEYGMGLENIMTLYDFNRMMENKNA